MLKIDKAIVLDVKVNKEGNRMCFEFGGGVRGELHDVLTESAIKELRDKMGELSKIVARGMNDKILEDVKKDITEDFDIEDFLNFVEEKTEDLKKDMSKEQLEQIQKFENRLKGAKDDEEKEQILADEIKKELARALEMLLEK